MPQIKISSRSHRFLQEESATLRRERGRRVTQAEVIELALAAYRDRKARAELAARQMAAAAAEIPAAR